MSVSTSTASKLKDPLKFSRDCNFKITDDQLFSTIRESLGIRIRWDKT